MSGLVAEGSFGLSFLLLFYAIFTTNFLLPVTIKAKVSYHYGKVTDAVSREELIGATIYLEEQQGIACITGFDGSYVLRNVPQGKFTVVCRYISYETQLQPISPGGDDSKLTLNFALQKANIELESVDIIANKDESTELAARVVEKNAGYILNAISAHSIELSPDLTVANVAQRVSGVAIEKNPAGGGEFISIRGMDKRYNSTSVNGIKIPGMDPKYRYVSLGLFPSELIDRLELVKSPTAEMEADGVGGIVNMVMKSAPDARKISFNVATGYNQHFFERNFTGFNSEVIHRETPYELNGKDYVAGENDFTKDNLALQSAPVQPDAEAGLVLSNRFFNKKLGLVVAGNYSNRYSGSENLRFSYSARQDSLNSLELGSADERFYYDHQRRYGLFAMIDYNFNPAHRVRWFHTYVDLSNEQVRETRGYDFNGYGPTSGYLTLNYGTRIRYTHQRLYNSILNGEHKLWPAIKLSWSAVFSSAYNEVPDNFQIKLLQSVEAFDEKDITVETYGTTRRWQRNSDEDIAGYLKISWEPFLFGKPSELSAGGLMRQKHRTSFYNEYRLIPNSGKPGALQNFAVKGEDWFVYPDIHWIIDPPNSTDPLNFEADEYITSMFVQGKFTTGRLLWYAGVRTEITDQGFKTKFPKVNTKQIGSQYYTNIFPSLNVKYTLTNDHAIRFLYYTSINRPGFLEIVPYEYKSEDYNEAGNPELKPALSTNFDIRYEIFPGMQKALLAGVFYKRVNDPIEYAFVTADATQKTIYQPGNYGDANIYGAELDVNWSIRWLGVKANYTWSKSAISTEKLLYVRDADGNIARKFVQQTRPLYGQAEHIINASLLFDISKLGTRLQLSGLYLSDRIAIVSQYYNKDQWERGRFQLDASCEQKIVKSLWVFAKVRNILDSPAEEYVKSEPPKAEGGLSDYPYQTPGSGQTLINRYRYGQLYLFGLRVRI